MAVLTGAYLEILGMTSSHSSLPLTTEKILVFPTGKER